MITTTLGIILAILFIVYLSRIIDGWLKIIGNLMHTLKNINDLSDDEIETTLEENVKLKTKLDRLINYVTPIIIVLSIIHWLFLMKFIPDL